MQRSSEISFVVGISSFPNKQTNKKKEGEAEEEDVGSDRENAEAHPPTSRWHLPRKRTDDV